MAPPQLEAFLAQEAQEVEVEAFSQVAQEVEAFLAQRANHSPLEAFLAQVVCPAIDRTWHKKNSFVAMTVCL